MPEKSNVEILKEAGALEDGNMSNEHRRILNEEFDPDEMRTIIKLKERIKGDPFSPSSNGGAF